MAAQMIESVQMSVHCTSKEIGLEDTSHFNTKSNYLGFLFEFRFIKSRLKAFKQGFLNVKEFKNLP